MDTSVMFERASLLREQGRLNEAIRELKNLLGQDPENAPALALYARCLVDRNEYDEGIRLLNEAIRIEPENAWFLYLKGFAYYRKDDNTAAIRFLNESITLQPSWPAAYGMLAIVYIEEKEFQKGLLWADLGLALDATDITCLNARAMSLNKLKQTDAAIETMKAALAEDPDNAFTHTTIGWNLLEKGKHKEARVHFREALRLDPDYANSKSGLKEALKSQIPPYRWLLQYSFWVSNMGKKAGWIVPLAIYAIVRVISASFSTSSSMSFISVIVVALYLAFVVATWIINPVANFFLLFNKDGKYALSLTEKWTAVTVMASIFSGLGFLLAGWLIPSTEDIPPMYMIAFSFLLMAVPLGDFNYPISFRGISVPQVIAMVLVLLAISTIIFALVSPDLALITGVSFLGLFILNNWLGVFRAIRR